VELEHRFEVPVGVEKAWAALLDIEQIGPCFPGAVLDHIDGDDFSGSVKLKLGPIRMTYKGTAKVVENDPVAHRARIEATGNAGGSTSTAAMLVTATASALAPNRTAVDLVTTLSLTGRPAQFGRGVMVDMGNTLIGQFADCVSTKLSGRSAGGAELIDVVDPDQVAAEVVAGEQVAAGVLHGAPTSDAAAQRFVPTQPIEPLNVLQSAGAPVLKRVLPVILGVVALILLRKLLRRTPDITDDDS
jgi:carbon monoxide dehydrogenase subunit G